jgi:hypothetical protein
MGVKDETGELMMLDKKERKLMMSILAKTMSSNAAKELILERLGEEYIKLDQNLLKHLGGG